MSELVEFPAGLRCRQHHNFLWHKEGFELSLLDDCDNAYRITAAVGVEKIKQVLFGFARFLQEDAFFILEYYPTNPQTVAPQNDAESPAPMVYYSPYLPTEAILDTLGPYLDRLIHDGFVGFGLASNRMGMELFYSEEKMLTFFTDNHLRLSHFLHQQQIPHDDNLLLTSDVPHDHLSLLALPQKELPETLRNCSRSSLDANLFCNELIEELDMYQVEEGLSFFLTRKEQEQIAQLMAQHLPDQDLADIEFGGLLLDWGDFVNECQNGFEGDLWEYRQCLRIRDSIQLIIELAEPELSDKLKTIIQQPDEQFSAILTDRLKQFDISDDIKLRQERFWYRGMVDKQSCTLRRDLIRYGWYSRSS